MRLDGLISLRIGTFILSIKICRMIVNYVVDYLLTFEENTESIIGYARCRDNICCFGNLVQCDNILDLFDATK